MNESIKNVKSRDELVKIVEIKKIVEMHRFLK